MLYILIFIFGLIVLFLAVSFLQVAKGRKRNVSQLQKPLEELLKRGFDGGTLVVEHVKTEKFIQFRKYISSQGVYGIDMYFPEVDWSRKFISSFRKICSSEGVEIEELMPGLDSPVRFLKVGFNKKADVAFWFMKKVVIDVFELPPDELFYVRLDGAHPKDVLVDH